MSLKRLVITAIAGASLAAGVAVSQTANDLPEGPGQDLVAKDCGVCHAITLVTTQRRTPAAWTETVDRMMSNGAPVTETEYPVIVAYLSKNFPAGAAKTSTSSGASGSAGAMAPATAAAAAATTMSTPAATVRTTTVTSSTVTTAHASTTCRSHCPVKKKARSKKSKG